MVIGSKEGENKMLKCGERGIVSSCIITPIIYVLEKQEMSLQRSMNRKCENIDP